MISFSSAATLSISPPQIDFIGNVGEEICQSIFVEVENIKTLTGKTLWAEENYFERRLINHIHSAEEFGIKVIFPQEIQIENSREIQICINGEKKGNYHGALLYKIKDKPIQVGTWMNVSLSKEISVSKLTGRATGGNQEGYGIFIALGILLLLIFIFLIIKYSLKEKEEIS